MRGRILALVGLMALGILLLPEAVQGPEDVSGRLPARVGSAGTEMLSPEMLLAAVLPGEASTSPAPECASVWDDFAASWRSPQTKDLLAAAEGVNGCRVGYLYGDPLAGDGALEFSHTIALLESEEQARRLFARVPDWFGFETQAQGQEVDDGLLIWSQRLPPEMGDRAVYLAGIAESPPQAFTFQQGRIVHIVWMDHWPARLTHDEGVQFARLAVSRAHAFGGDPSRSARPGNNVSISVQAYVVGGVAEGVLDRLGTDVIEHALEEVEDIYNRHGQDTGYRVRLLLAGVDRIGAPEEMDYGRDTAGLTGQHSQSCRLEVFYVARRGQVGGWAWVPQTSAFINARLYGNLLAVAQRHGRALAHELGHLWGLAHSDLEDNLMSSSGAGKRLEPDQANLIDAYLNAWLSACE